MRVVRGIVRWLGLRAAGAMWAVLLRGALAGAVGLGLMTLVWVGFGLTGAAIRGDMWQGFAVGWWVTMLAAAGLYRRHSHRVKGYVGEFYVMLTLRVWLASGRRYHDAYLPLDGRVTQIDHIVICTRGVFVIETKNWSGRIHGWPDDERWSVDTRWARHSAINPVRQNDEHARAVAMVLGEAAPIVPIVALVGWGRLESGHVPGVTRGLTGLVRGIMERKDIVASREVEDLAGRLEAALLPRDAETRARHDLSVSRVRRGRSLS